MKNHTTFKIKLDLNIELKSSELKDIIEAFKKAIILCFQDFIKQALFCFSQEYMKSGEPAKMLGSKKVTWKTSKGNKSTQIKTIFGTIHVPQIQATIGETHKRKMITRILLGIEAYKRIPDITIKALGLMGALASYRVVKKIASMFTDVGFSLMTILRCIRKTGKMIDFEIDEKERNVFDADGNRITY